MHKPHKVARENHKKAQAQASVWAQPMANAVIPHVHVPQQYQQQPQNSDTMDVDQGGDVFCSNVTAVEVGTHCKVL